MECLLIEVQLLANIVDLGNRNSTLSQYLNRRAQYFHPLKIAQQARTKSLLCLLSNSKNNLLNIFQQRRVLRKLLILIFYPTEVG